MRTCPACGEDTEASSVEPCTECGFSPVDPAQFETEPDPRFETVGFEEADATFEVGSAEAPPAPAEPAPEQEPSSEKKKRPWASLAIWLTVALAAFAAERAGLFGEATGPAPEEVENALVAYAAARGGTVTVDCPSDTEDTEIGGSFDCVATNPRGQTRAVTVTNNETDFEWDGTPLVELIRRDR